MMKPTQLCDEPQRRHMAGEYINSKAGKKRIKKEWKYREKKDELHTFKDTTIDTSMITAFCQ